MYLLQCEKDKKYYIGWTTNLLRRLGEHNEGSTSSTKSRGPFKLVGFETYATKKEAMLREKLLKKNHRMSDLFKKRVSLCSPALAQKEVAG